MGRETSLVSRSSKQKTLSVKVLHLFRFSTHTPRCREAILCDKGKRCQSALICSLRLDISMKSKCRQRNANELAGQLMKGHRVASRSGANRRCLIGPPCPGPAWLGLVRCMPNGWQSEPNLQPQIPVSGWHSHHHLGSRASQGSLHWIPCHC